MARTGRPRSGPELVVTEAQRRELVRGARAATSTQAYALRCRIVLACAEPGAFSTHVTAEVGVSAMTVRKWRSRFIEYGLAGLADEPRPGRPPSILLDQVQRVVELTLEQLPADATHWSRASMAERTGLSRSTVGRIWRRFDLKPHLSERVQDLHRPAVRGEGRRRRRFVTRSARTGRWCSAWTRSPRSRPWTVHSRSCR